MHAHIHSCVRKASYPTQHNTTQHNTTQHNATQRNTKHNRLPGHLAHNIYHALALVQREAMGRGDAISLAGVSAVAEACR